MRDHNFLTENNTKHLWQPMANPAEVKDNPPRIITGAEGVRITDIDGHSMIDAVGGLWNANLGYSCEPIKQAIADQLQTLPYYSSFRGTMPGPAIELAYELREWFAEDGLTRAFFTSGGSDSIDVSLRLARQYHKLRSEGERVKFISFKKGYHGTHWGGASINGNANFRRNYEPLLPGCIHIPAPYPYRNPFGETDPARLAQLIAATLEDEIAFNGATTIAAFIMEPILGAGGVIPPHETLMPMIREICDRNGILLIADEVITAFGRTGAWTGSRLWGVQPDMTCFAKAITNAYFPMGGVMISERLVDAFETSTDATGSIGSGYTYSGHPVGAAAALACLEETKRLNVIENAAARGTQLYEGCKRLMEKHELIGDVRGGHGMMTALECVADRDSKAPAPGPKMAKVQETAYAEGVMIRVSGPNIILSPPLILDEADASAIIDALDAGFTSAG
ncbi:aminotransferase class III-fold pyridoxal phosphate-dependent enzyme [Alterinioella nitratireducens]|uniref:aminotransferase class III-fold pyridoxal phosphate-dependent enzyme n=1 Tax=Alterinioella nitratireducens TaxID=2735915 RepID=UPI00405859D7